MGTFTIVNNTSSAISVFVSKYTNSKGSDDWYSVPAGQAETWDRNGWELVAFKNANDSGRAGVYIHTNKTVTFNSLDNIGVH